MLFDTHSHPYLAKEKTQEEILESFFLGGGKYLNSIGVDIPSSEKSIELAKKYNGVFATIGVHPNDVLSYKDSIGDTVQIIKKLYIENKAEIIAVGETGLDYYWLSDLVQKNNIEEKDLINLQKTFFREHIRLSKELDLPLVIHNRGAKDDVYELLKEESCHNFVFHCYSEDFAYAKKLLSLSPNAKIGIGGVATFKNASKVQETVKNVPLESIVIETDSPYLTPTPFRGKQENEPILVKHVLSHIIDLRPESAENIQERIFRNSCDFFKIKER